MTATNTAKNTGKILQIVHLDSATIGPGAALNKPQTPHHWTSYERTDDSQVIDRLADADIAVLNKVAITTDHLGALPH